MKTTHESSPISMTLVSRETGVHEICHVSPDLLEKFGDTVILDPVISDGMGDKKVYVNCKFCNKERLTILAEACRVDFKRGCNLSKHSIYLSGNDSYYLQVKVENLGVSNCKCQ